MTHAERAEIEAAVPTAPLLWAPHADPRFIQLLAPGGCPLLRMDGTQAVCTVHAVRPYNCRTFMCGRVSLDEKFDASGPMGCRNLSDRLEQSLDAQCAYDASIRRARVWGLAHGWGTA